MIKDNIKTIIKYINIDKLKTILSIIKNLRHQGANGMKAKVMEPSAGKSNEIHIKDHKRYKQNKLTL